MRYKPIYLARGRKLIDDFPCEIIDEVDINLSTSRGDGNTGCFTIKLWEFN